MQKNTTSIFLFEIFFVTLQPEIVINPEKSDSMRKHILLLAAMMLAATSLFAQSADNEDEVIKIDQWNQNAYREGEILVKFKADGAVQMRAPRKAKFQTSQVNAVDALFEELGVDSIEQLMPMTGHKDVGRVRRAYNGKEVKVQDLSKLYRLTLKAEKAQTMFEAIDKLKAQEEVEFAEPNYIVYTMALPYDEEIPTADQQTYTSEPLYSQQWGLQAINLPALWDKPKKSSKRPVIAILDTGVDIEHPDLEPTSGRMPLKLPESPDKTMMPMVSRTISTDGVS